LGIHGWNRSDLVATSCGWRSRSITLREQLSNAELEASYKTALDPIGKSHFHALWLNEVEEVAELLSFSSRCMR
jgi:hypothetical protein